MIVTFYSYKGGVGRSMALVNVGEMLADIGYDVVLCDFDLEAPGLERYVADEDGPANALRANRGVIDLLEEYKDTLADPDDPEDFAVHRADPQDAEAEADRHDAAQAVRHGISAAGNGDFRDVRGLSLRRPSGCAVPVRSANRTRLGRLRFLSAGRRDGTWATRYRECVQRFDWADFYAKWAGAAYIDFFRQDLTEGQTIVLLDSRTGVTEQGGICTHHLADLVLLMSAPNDINVEGTQWMADALANAEVAELRGGRPLQILPVAARVETASQVAELGMFRERFERAFARRVPAAVGDGTGFIQAAEIPYIPYFAFKEKVVAREGSGPRHRELHRAYETVAAAIVDIGLERELLPPPRRRDWLDERRVRRAANSLQSIIERHGRWLSSNRAEGDRAVLRDRDLSRIELTGTDLREADLTGANLERADLREADLSRARLTRVTLQGAKLEGATLTGADLERGDLTGAVLARATLDFCDLAGARLEGARLTESRIRGANLRDARLTRADLARCDLRDTDLTDAVLLGADLRGANLTGATGTEAEQLRQAITDGTTRGLDDGPGASWMRRSSMSSAAASAALREVEIVPVRDQREHPGFAVDFRVLDETLMQAFRDADAEALRNTRRHRNRRFMLILTITAATMLGMASGFVDPMPMRLQQVLLVVAALGTVVTGYLADNLRKVERQALTSRRRAQRLRSEYFRYLGRVGLYADTTSRRSALHGRVAQITGGRTGW